MKFGQFMSYYKRKNSSKIRLFVFAKNKAQLLLENEIFEISYCPNQHADLLIIVFTKDSLKIKKGLGLVFRPHFS